MDRNNENNKLGKATHNNNVNIVYGAVTVIANHAKLWFRRLLSGNFDVKD